MTTRKVGRRLGPNRYRWQGRDPWGGRVSVTARSQAELDWQVRKYTEQKSLYRHGAVTEEEMRRALAPITEAEPLTVRRLFDRYIETVPVAWKHVAKNHYRRRIAPWFGERRAAEVTETELRRWLADLETYQSSSTGRTYAPRTIRGAYECLASAYRLAISSGELSRFPWGDFRPRAIKEPRDERGSARTPAELFRVFGALLHADRERWAQGQYSALAFTGIVAGLTGARQAELCALAWDQLQIDEPPFTLRFRYQAPKRWRARQPGSGERPLLPTKSRRSRLQALHPSAVAILRAQREQLRARGWYRHDGPVFPGRGGTWRTSGAAIKSQTFREVVRAAGIEDWQRWSPHSLRHSMASLETWAAARTDGDLRRVAARTGHSDLRILESYLHPVASGLAESKIPELPLELTTLPNWSAVPPGAEAPAEPPALPEPVTFGSPAAARREKRNADSRRPFDELAREWLDRGRPGPRPPAVTRRVNSAYTRAYQRARYDGKGSAEARAAGARAKRAALGAWGQALARVERERGGGA